MKKVKYLFMKTVKVKEYMKEVEDIPKKSKTVIMERDEKGEKVDAITAGGGSWFDDDFYDNVQEPQPTQNEDISNLDIIPDCLYEDNVKRKVYVRSTDNLEKMTVDDSYRVTKREALTSIEAKTPFIVGKIDGKKLRIDENDIVYKTIPKMQHQDGKRAMRIGYIQVSDKLKCRHLKLENNENIVGLLHDDYIITKKKGFNQEKIGYIKLKDDDSGIDKYVEVTKGKGARDLLMWLLLIAIIILLSNFKLPEDWHFDWKNLKLYKTEEQIENKESIVKISHNAKAVLVDSMIQLDLTSETESEADGELLFTLKIIDSSSGESVFESELLEAGSSVAEIKLDKAYSNGEYGMTIECITYKNNKFNYVGTVESSFIMVVN